MGAFSIELYPSHAPRTVQNFLELSRRGYYDNTVFHRIINDFMVQGGDPTGTGRGGESIKGGCARSDPGLTRGMVTLIRVCERGTRCML